MGTLNDLKMPSLNDKIVEKDTLAKAEAKKVKKVKEKKVGKLGKSELKKKGKV